MISKGNYCINCEASVRKKKTDYTLERCIELCHHNKKIKREACFTKCRGFKSIALKSVQYTNNKFRDCLIKIANKCGETDICTFVNTFDDLSALFDRSSPDVTVLLETATRQTSYCRKIDVQLLAYGAKEVVRSPKSYISSQSLQKLITKGDTEIFERIVKKLYKFYDLIKGIERQNMSVEVSMLPTKWIFRHREEGDTTSFKYFIKALAE